MPRILTPIAAELAATYGAGWARFGSLLDAIDAALAQLPPDSAWPIVGKSDRQVGTVTLADFRYKFGNFSWALTNRDYSSVNGGVGQVVSRFDQDHLWVGAAEEIRASDFATYMRWPELKGATYLALHEVAHTTELGMTIYHIVYDEFRHMGGDRDHFPRSPQWWYNERMANRIALTVAEAIGFPILDEPTGGYNLDVMIRKMEIA